MLSDNEIRNKLNNYSSPVSEKVWKRIVSEQQNNKILIHSYFTGARLFFFVGLLFTLSLVGLFIFNEGNRKTIAGISKNIVSSVEVNVTAKENGYSKNKPIIFNLPVTSLPLNEKKHRGIANTDKSNTTINNTLENSVPENIENTTISPVNEATTIEDNVFANTQESNNIAYTKDAKITDAAINLEKGNIEHIFLNTLYPIKDISTKKIPKISHNSFIPIECPGEYNSYKKNWYVEGFIAPEYVTKKVLSNHTNDAYLMKKDSVESMLLGVTAGVKFTKGLTNNLYIKGGLQYSQLIEKMNLLQEKERKEITVITIKTETDINGNTITKSDTTKQIQILFANTTKYSSYKNIELPISLGYEFYRRGFRASVNAGVIVNLSSWYSGKLLDTNYQFVSIKEKPGVYKQNIGFSLYGSISLIKPLSESAEIFAEPYFRYSLSSPKYNTYGFKQKFNAVGLALGLRFKLNKQNSGRTTFN